MSITTIHSEFNVAVLRLALGYLANGDYKELADLGLTTEIIDELREFSAQDLVMLSSYSTSGVCVRSGTIDAQHVLQLIRSVKRKRREEEQILKFVRLRAPRTLMRDLFGLTADDYSHYRRRAGLHGDGMGRPGLPDDETQATVWRVWRATQGLPEQERYLRLARDTGLPLNSALQALKQGETTALAKTVRNSSAKKTPSA